MKELKYRQAVTRGVKHEFVEWHYWGFLSGNSDFTAPKSAYQPAHKQSYLFTGLKDKNGKEIYEGDFVSYGTEDEIVTAKVVWQTQEDEETAWISGLQLQVVKTEDYPDDDDADHALEVIGNIYETPDIASQEV